MKRIRNHSKPIVAVVLCIGMILSTINTAFAITLSPDWLDGVEKRTVVTEKPRVVISIDEDNKKIIVSGLDNLSSEERKNVMGEYDYQDLDLILHGSYDHVTGGADIINQKFVDAEKYSNESDGIGGGSSSYKKELKKEKERIENVYDVDDIEVVDTNGNVIHPNDKFTVPNEINDDVMGPYDTFLCWAATSANMIWSSGYAKDVTIPGQNKTFQNEDEVFEYLRTYSKEYYREKNRKENRNIPDETGDRGGSILQGIEWFIKGTNQAKETEIDNFLNENVVKLGSTKQKDKNDPVELLQPEEISFLESLDKYSIGLSIGWVRQTWNQTTHALDYAMANVGHAVTVNGIITNPKAEKIEDKYLGIIIADSDNNTVASYDSQLSDSQKRQIASEEPNIYSTYELELKDFGTLGKLWTIVDYIEEGFEAAIRGITGLLVKDAKPVVPSKPQNPTKIDEENKSETNPANPNNNSANNSSNNPSTPTNKPQENNNPGTVKLNNSKGTRNPIITENLNWEDYIENQPEETAHVIQDGIDYTAIKEFMTREDWLLYSPKNWKYSLSKDTTFRIYVRTSIQNLSEIHLDDVLLGEEDFETAECMDGLFLLILNEQKMKSLSEGEHDFRIQLNGYEEQTRTITVK